MIGSASVDEADSPIFTGNFRCRWTSQSVFLARAKSVVKVGESGLRGDIGFPNIPLSVWHMNCMADYVAVSFSFASVAGAKVRRLRPMARALLKDALSA
jgi:hypothetical protein